MRRANVITEGAILLALFLILMLLALYIPFLGAILLFVLPLPFMMFTMRHGLSLSIFILIAGSLLSIFFGAVTNLLIAFMFGLSGLVMGLFYRRKQVIGAIIGGSIAYTVGFIIFYIGSIYLLEIDIVKDFFQLLKDSMEQSKAMVSEINPNLDVEKQFKAFEEALALIITLLPSCFVMGGIIFALITHHISMPILKRLKFEMPIFYFKDIKFPTSVIWYFLLVSILMMIPGNQEGFYYTAIVNLYYILMFLLIIQGYSFLFYYANKKGLSKGIPVIILIVSFLIPIFLYLVRILGIIDLCFPLRDKITKK